MLEVNPTKDFEGFKMQKISDEMARKEAYARNEKIVRNGEDFITRFSIVLTWVCCVMFGVWFWIFMWGVVR